MSEDDAPETLATGKRIALRWLAGIVYFCTVGPLATSFYDPGFSLAAQLVLSVVVLGAVAALLGVARDDEPGARLGRRVRTVGLCIAWAGGAFIASVGLSNGTPEAIAKPMMAVGALVFVVGFFVGRGRR